MVYMPVDIVVVDANDAPLAGVLVKVFDEAGAVAHTEGTTDGAGLFSCLLFTQTYQVRCYKRQVAFGRPRLLPVVADAVNRFTVTGSPFVPPTSNDARLCLASGFFRTPNGEPARNVSVHFIAKFDPILLDGEAVLSPERVQTRTDSDGFMRVALIRFGKYDVIIEGLENVLREISIPDRSSVNLPDLLFPVVATVLLDPPGPYTIAHGQEIAVTAVVTTSSGEVLPGTATANVTWRSSDSNVLGVLPSATTIALRGISAGSAQVTAERLDTSIIRIPDVPLVGVPVTVTVT